MIARIDPRIKAADLAKAMHAIGCRVLATQDGCIRIVKADATPQPAKPVERTA